MATAFSIGLFFWMIVSAFGVMLYFLPSILAVVNHRRNSATIVVLNILLGWSFVGWIAALVMALMKDSEPVRVVHVHEHVYAAAQPPGTSIEPVVSERPEPGRNQTKLSG
ncbi:MAG TPA: superinfection immunity protein [Candidatus Cybelea sp.]|nr:superinfection immunity protein [Candidatus Cybelea sp.]